MNNEHLQGFISLLGECKEWEVVEALTITLKPEFKAELWKRLPANEKLRIKKLKEARNRC